MKQHKYLISNMLFYVLADLPPPLTKAELPEELKVIGFMLPTRHFMKKDVSYLVFGVNYAICTPALLCVCIVFLVI